MNLMCLSLSNCRVLECNCRSQTSVQGLEWDNLGHNLKHLTIILVILLFVALFFAILSMNLSCMC